jgi:alkylation response protein AidB-like acyl-CoA dehydrogenase
MGDKLSGVHATDEPQFQAAVRHLLDDALQGFERRKPTVLGAGTDDVDAVRDFMRRLAPHGLLVPRWPTSYGGAGLSGERARFVETEIKRHFPPDLYPVQVGLSLAGPALLKFGTAAQCERWLPNIVNGSQIWCQLFSEPEAGSDLAGLRTRAEQRPDGWAITGSKVWSSRAHYADRGLLLARFDPSLPKHDGIVAFAIDMHAPGVTVRPLRQMNGDTHFSEVFLDDVIVPDTDRIAGVGEGWAVARAVLALERATFGSEGSGTGAGVRKRLVDLAKHRDVASDPVLLDTLIRVWCDLEVAKLTARRVGAIAAAKGDATRAAAGAKLRMAKNLRAVADLALELNGVSGLTNPDDWHELFLTAPSMSIRGGTDEVLRNNIGESVLGLPREHRTDRGPFNEIGRRVRDDAGR